MVRSRFLLMAALAPVALLLAIQSPVTAAGGGGHGGGGGGGGGGGHAGGGVGGGYGGHAGGYGGGYGYGGRGYGGYGYGGYGYGGYGFGGLGYGYGGYGYGAGPYGFGYGAGYGFLGVGLDSPPPIYVVNPSPTVLVAGGQNVPPAMPPVNASLYYNPTPPPAATDNRAQVRVRVPADAVLWFDGVPTTQTGPEREFVTPALTPDREFVYDVKARWMQAGQPVERLLTVKVRANQTSTLDFNELPAPKG